MLSFLFIFYPDCFLSSFSVTPFFSLSGAPHENYQALWFERGEDRITGEQIHVYKGGYWEAKDRGSWDGCPDIFWPRHWLQSAPKRLSHRSRLVDSYHKAPPPYLDGCLPPVALCSKRSPGRSLLSDPEGKQGFWASFIPFWFLSPRVPLVAVTHLRGLEWKCLCCFDSGQAEHKGEEMGSASKSTVDNCFSLSAQVCSVSQIRSRRGFVLITPCQIM